MNFDFKAQYSYNCGIYDIYICHCKDPMFELIISFQYIKF